MNKHKDVKITYCESGAENLGENDLYHYMASYYDVPFKDNVYCWGDSRIEALSKLMMWEEKNEQ